MTKTILITGASSGIGAAAALALADSRHRLILAARSKAKLEILANRARERGSEAQVFPIDLANLAEIDALASSLKGEGSYPVLINAAGTASFAEFADLSWADLETQHKINFLAPARLIQAALPIMLAKGGGQIVNVLSMVCVNVMPFGGGYSTSKAALQMLGKIVSAEYRQKGIKVTNLMPGAVDTPLWDGTPMESRKPEMIPAEEVANLIAQLVRNPHSFNLDEILMMPSTGVL